MDPLSTVENILGSVETWPSTIIIDFSITKPCTISVTNIAAFMYGNNDPVEKAVDCFVAYVEIDSYYVSCSVKDWYTTCDNLPHKTHLARYYSVAFKRWMWLNGKYAAQNEAVYPDDDVMNSIGDFGTENAECPLLIYTTIRHIRSYTSVT